MTNHKWTDTTTYSSSDNDRIPSIWNFRAGSIRICVHRHIHYPKNKWLLSCEPFFSKHELDHEHIDEAKYEALALVNMKLKDAISKIIEAL